jgi:hypothetical protein
LYDRDRGDPIGNAAYRSLMLLPFTGSVRASAVKARRRRIGNDRNVAQSSNLFPRSRSSFRNRR